MVTLWQIEDNESMYLNSVCGDEFNSMWSHFISCIVWFCLLPKTYWGLGLPEKNTDGSDTFEF